MPPPASPPPPARTLWRHRIRRSAPESQGSPATGGLPAHPHLTWRPARCTSFGRRRRRARIRRSRQRRTWHSAIGPLPSSKSKPLRGHVAPRGERWKGGSVEQAALVVLAARVVGRGLQLAALDEGAEFLVEVVELGDVVFHVLVRVQFVPLGGQPAGLVHLHVLAPPGHVVRDLVARLILALALQGQLVGGGRVALLPAPLGLVG